MLRVRPSCPCAERRFPVSVSHSARLVQGSCACDSLLSVPPPADTPCWRHRAGIMFSPFILAEGRTVELALCLRAGLARACVAVLRPHCSALLTPAVSAPNTCNYLTYFFSVSYIRATCVCDLTLCACSSPPSCSCCFCFTPEASAGAHPRVGRAGPAGWGVGGAGRRGR